MNAGSLCTLISTKGYSLQATAPGLAQKERKSSRYLILSLSVYRFGMCVLPPSCVDVYVHSCGISTHTRNPGSLRRALVANKAFLLPWCTVSLEWM